MKSYKAAPKAATCLLFFTLSLLDLQGQSDTVLLEEVIVTASSAKYLPGGNHVEIHTDSLAIQDVSRALSLAAPIYFIQYGAQGQLSSINLRGLGAARTNVVWQGVEINSFSLGQTDFSEFTAGVADRVDLQMGAVGSLLGNGALGGTVVLASKVDFEPGHQVNLRQDLGSYGFWGTRLKHSYSNSRFTFRTKLIGREAINDFSYLQGTTTRRQQNAGFTNMGWAHDLHWRMRENHIFSFHFWHNQADREIQPHRNDLDARDEISTQTTRLTAIWQWHQRAYTGRFQVAYTHDYQVYNETSGIEVDRWMGAYEMEWANHPRLSLKAGVNINHLLADVTAFGDEQVAETRNDLYASMIWKFPSKATLVLNLRAPMLNSRFKHFSPLASLQYPLIDKNRWTLRWNLQGGSSYRLPTLNDRYWQPGGNQDLKAETSMNLESGLEVEWGNGPLRYQAHTRYFLHHVDQWIIWIPGGREETPDGGMISFWYPANIREVVATGVEHGHTLYWKLPWEGWNTHISIQGLFNRAINKKPLNSLDRSVNKQLPYTPRHVYNGSWQVSNRKWHAGLAVQYYGRRFVEANNELPAIPGYSLWRVQAGRKGTLMGLQWQGVAQVLNLFDRSYENFENRAMPGRNYMLSLILSYK